MTRAQAWGVRCCLAAVPAGLVVAATAGVTTVLLVLLAAIVGALLGGLAFGDQRFGVPGRAGDRPHLPPVRQLRTTGPRPGVVVRSVRSVG